MAPAALRATVEGVGRHTCCISRSDARRMGAVSGPSRGGHAERNAPTYRLKSLTDVSMPPIGPNDPFASSGSFFHCSSSQR